MLTSNISIIIQYDRNIKLLIKMKPFAWKIILQRDANKNFTNPIN